MSPGHGTGAESVNCLGLVSHHKHHLSDQWGFPEAALSQVLYLPPPFSEAVLLGTPLQARNLWPSGRKGENRDMWPPACISTASVSFPPSLPHWPCSQNCWGALPLPRLLVPVCTPGPSPHLQASVKQGLHSPAEPRTLLPGSGQVQPGSQRMPRKHLLSEP